MAQGIAWREKVATTLITLILTALGSVAYQSAKFLIFDFSDALDASKQRYDSKAATQHEARNKELAFSVQTNKLLERLVKRDKLLDDSLKSLAADHLNDKRLVDALDGAYRDLGLISYTPTFDSTSEAEKNTFIENLKAQTEGLGLLHTWAERPGDAEAKFKLAQAWERNSFQRREGLSAAIAVMNASRATTEDSAKQIQSDLTEYQNEIKEQSKSAHIAISKLAVSLLLYAGIFGFMLSRPKEEGQEVKLEEDPEPELAKQAEAK